VQLTDGMAKLIGTQPFHGLRYEGQASIAGQDRFLEAQIAYALKRPDMADAVRAFLRAMSIRRLHGDGGRARQSEDDVHTPLDLDHAARA
jgi:hypothetical protein